MEKINIVLISIGLLVFSFGCQNTTDPNIKEEIKNVSVSNTEVFEYQTGISGDEELATIEKHPKNYEISTIVRDSTTNWEAVYQYKPESGFQGTDYVELKLGTGSNGASPNKNITVIKLNITVN
jgi:hypothetical protein